MNILDVSSPRACHVHAPPTIPSPQGWLSKCPSWCHKFMGNICRFRPERISQPPHHLQPVFSRGSVVRVFNPNCGAKDFSLHSKGKITSVLCLWARWCETIKHPEMPSMRQTNQERMLTFPGKSAATEPSQMEKTHFEWQHFKRGPIAGRCAAHTPPYTPNIRRVFEYMAAHTEMHSHAYFAFSGAHLST